MPPGQYTPQSLGLERWVAQCGCEETCRHFPWGNNLRTQMSHGAANLLYAQGPENLVNPYSLVVAPGFRSVAKAVCWEARWQLPRRPAANDAWQQSAEVTPYPLPNRARCLVFGASKYEKHMVGHHETSSTLSCTSLHIRCSSLNLLWTSAGHSTFWSASP